MLDDSDNFDPEKGWTLPPAEAEVAPSIDKTPSNPANQNADPASRNGTLRPAFIAPALTSAAAISPKMSSMLSRLSNFLQDRSPTNAEEWDLLSGWSSAPPPAYQSPNENIGLEEAPNVNNVRVQALKAVDLHSIFGDDDIRASEENETDSEPGVTSISPDTPFAFTLEAGDIEELDDSELKTIPPGKAERSFLHAPPKPPLRHKKVESLLRAFDDIMQPSSQFDPYEADIDRSPARSSTPSENFIYLSEEDFDSVPPPRIAVEEVSEYDAPVAVSSKIPSVAHVVFPSDTTSEPPRSRISLIHDAPPKPIQPLPIKSIGHNAPPSSSFETVFETVRREPFKIVSSIPPAMIDENEIEYVDKQTNQPQRPRQPLYGPFSVTLSQDGSRISQEPSLMPISQSIYAQERHNMRLKIQADMQKTVDTFYTNPLQRLFRRLVRFFQR